MYDLQNVTYYLALYRKACLTPELETIAIILLIDDYSLDESCGNGEVKKWSSSRYVLKLESTELYKKN